jgi:ketosteroid isomerase-like protein
MSIRELQSRILRNTGGQIQARLALARPLDAYFAAKNRHDVDAMLDCFAQDAIVLDEARERRGKTAIRQWIEETTRKYRVSVEVLDASESEGNSVVAGLVSGNFPGSPVKLRYAFALSDGRIVRLEIKP